MERQKDVQKTMPLVVRSKTNGANEWQHLPVASRHGRIVYLSDIATMRLREQLPNSYHRINGREYH
ncbi:MAG: hypothetical protein U5K79_05880 [Cyclobacteriaceae bacterium]|nr:hypothetical protein [Cyclobacteriaceae bacterium]